MNAICNNTLLPAPCLELNKHFPQFSHFNSLLFLRISWNGNIRKLSNIKFFDIKKLKRIKGIQLLCYKFVKFGTIFFSATVHK